MTNFGYLPRSGVVRGRWPATSRSRRRPARRRNLPENSKPRRVRVVPSRQVLEYRSAIGMDRERNSRWTEGDRRERFGRGQQRRPSVASVIDPTPLDLRPQVELVSAARSYAAGLWWSNEEDQSWPHLVTAVEIAANRPQLTRGSPEVLIREPWPELWTVVATPKTSELQASLGLEGRASRGTRSAPTRGDS